MATLPHHRTYECFLLKSKLLLFLSVEGVWDKFRRQEKREGQVIMTGIKRPPGLLFLLLILSAGVLV